MLKTLKKILRIAFLLCLCVVSFVSFTACNMLSLDTQKDYNQIVVVAGDLSFTKRDLIENYYSYGYQYYQNSNDIKSALKQTAKTMVQRELLFEEIKKIIDITNFEGVDYTNEIRYNVFDSMQQAYDKIEKEIRKEWYDEEFNEAEKKTPLRTEKIEYKPTVKLNEQNELIRIIESDENNNLEQMPADFETYNKKFESQTDNKLNAETWSRYIKSLQSVAKNENRPLDKQSLLKFEQERLIKLYTNNKYIELYKEYVLKNAEISTAEVVRYFKNEYEYQYSLFNGLLNTSAYDTAMSKASSEFVFYHDEKSEGYIYVNHILIKFGDTVSQMITNKKNEYGITTEEQESELLKDKNSNYYKDYQEILKAVEVTYEKDGVVQKPITLSAVQDEIIQSVNSIQLSDTQERFQEFERLMYLYNDDAGAMNADFYYNVNLDTDVQDKMLKRFADASRTLASDYNLGQIYAGGPFDGLVITEYETGKYGAHIIIHGGLSGNFITPKNIDSLTYDMLLNQKVNPASDKTLFQYFYDKLQLDNDIFDKATESIVNTRMSEIGNVEYREHYYKNLWS